MSDQYTFAVWRRKTASARIRLFASKWDNMINWKPVAEYINRVDLFEVIYSPLKLCWVKDLYSFQITVNGSWESAQIQAISLWISRALAEMDGDFKKLLRWAWLLTRDARKVERKKPWHHKARKSSQWSKR